ncbi:hypothetical protein LCI18_001144 [Fusarium solani-melongenae]|uniref:Uncharacterized protein n=1 Tax=Fusarium solani subsp. cucurbitae TaxID=2747967 RepID=A0ACD3YMN4_FUSSC|nr:hypothetical protein LCI18_001144 [Fusarium solani-melongenae]
MSPPVLGVGIGTEEDLYLRAGFGKYDFVYLWLGLIGTGLSRFHQRLQVSFSCHPGEGLGLAQKFRNTSVMLEAEHYRPKLFYTDHCEDQQLIGHEAIKRKLSKRKRSKMKGRDLARMLSTLYDFMYLRGDFANDCNVGGSGCLNEKTTVYSLNYPIKGRASTVIKYVDEINTLRNDKEDGTQVGEE